MNGPGALLVTAGVLLFAAMALGPGLDEAVRRAREAVADVVLPRDEDDR